MSHEATNWAFKQRGLKPATKMVLLGLANCHNPHRGCFPSKKRLAQDCEMSERSVSDHLRKLEEAGLILVESGGKTGEGQFSSNRYILGFEPDFHAVQNLPSANSAVGKTTSKPSANSAVDRRQNLPSNPVRESRKETVREDHPSDDPASSFAEFWETWPLRKVAKQKAKTAFNRLSKQNRQDAIERCGAWAENWRRANPTATDIHPTTYLNGKRWEDEFSPASNVEPFMPDRQDRISKWKRAAGGSSG